MKGAPTVFTSQVRLSPSSKGRLVLTMTSQESFANAMFTGLHFTYAPRLIAYVQPLANESFEQTRCGKRHRVEGRRFDSEFFSIPIGISLSC